MPGKTDVAAPFAAAVEFSWLHRTPALDAFRLTAAGALPLGRVFSYWNILAYGAGIGLGAALDLAFAREPDRGLIYETRRRCRRKSG